MVGEAGLGRPAHIDQLSGHGRPLRKSCPAELRRLSSVTYDFRPADRTDDYSAADFVISEVLQQTDFDGIRHGVLSGWRSLPSTELDKIFDQALILWCGMVTCGRAGIPVLGRDMGALGFKFPTTHRAYGGAGSELRRAEGGMVRSSEGTQRRSFSSLG